MVESLPECKLLLLPSKLRISVIVGHVMGVSQKKSFLAYALTADLVTEKSKYERKERSTNREQSFISGVHVIQFRYS